MGLHWYSLPFPQSKKGILMIGDYLEDHGLPLAQLKQRRDLIVALMGRTGRITKQQIAEIAAIQRAIAAVEAVVVDLDTEVIVSMLSERRPCKPALVC
jgi:hypothetical protein